MTDEEIWIDMVETNLNICQLTIFDAERCNKGRYVHKINSTLYKLKPKFAKLEKMSPCNVAKDDFAEMCKLRMVIGDALYLNSKGAKP